VFEGRADLTRNNYAALDFKRWLHSVTGYPNLEEDLNSLAPPPG